MDHLNRTVLDWLLLSLQTLLLLLIVSGNLLVIISVLTAKVLRIPRNYMILSLAVADLLVGLFVLPIKITVTELDAAWDSKSLICSLWVGCDIMVTTASILSLTAISLDRYVAVSHPLFHRTHHSCRVLSVAICVVWMLSFIAALPYWLQVNRHVKCVHVIDDLPPCTAVQPAWYQITLGLGAFFIPLGILIFVNFKIWVILAQQKNKIEGTKAPAIEPLDLSFSQSIVVGIQERKGFITMGVVILAFVGSWLPIYAYVVIEGIGRANGLFIVVMTPTLYDILIWIGYFNSCVNPFIYTMFSDEFYIAFREILCLRGATLNETLRNRCKAPQSRLHNLGNKCLTR